MVKPTTVKPFLYGILLLSSDSWWVLERKEDLYEKNNNINILQSNVSSTYARFIHLSYIRQIPYFSRVPDFKIICHKFHHVYSPIIVKTRICILIITISLKFLRCICALNYAGIKMAYNFLIKILDCSVELKWHIRNNIYLALMSASTCW